MASRYDSREIALNNNKYYRELMKNRDVPYITQFRTARLKHPSVREINNLELIGHIWTVGDRFYKLAHEFYGDPELWWVIAWFNRTPTEGHIKQGDLIHIPLPLDRLLGYLDV